MATLDTHTAKPRQAVPGTPALPAGADGVALPPPPPPVSPRPTALQVQLLGGLFGAGVLLALIGALGEFRYQVHVELGGMFLATYATLVAASWLPPNVLTKRLDAWLDRWVRNSGAGYYGVMALGAFVALEIPNAIENLTDFDLDVKRMIMDRVMRFSRQSLENFIRAIAWPGLVMPRGDILGAAALVGGTWAVFKATARILPHATFAKKPKQPKAAKKKT